jgi:hypothetical protein
MHEQRMQEQTQGDQGDSQNKERKIGEGMSEGGHSPQGQGSMGGSKGQ